MLIVSFFTRDWQYPQHAARLARECDALGLNHRIEELPTTRSYAANCRMKPAYISRCLQEHRGPVLWVDVDASICRRPSFFSDDDPFDLQAKRMGAHRKRTWHVGTLWWNYTPEALAFIERWVANTAESTDESSLEATVREGLPLCTRDIPWEYSDWECMTSDPVIRHRLSKGVSKYQEMPELERYEREVI